jgi:hypothetical protein
MMEQHSPASDGSVVPQLRSSHEIYQYIRVAESRKRNCSKCYWRNRDTDVLYACRNDHTIQKASNPLLAIAEAVAATFGKQSTGYFNDVRIPRNLNISQISYTSVEAVCVVLETEKAQVAFYSTVGQPVTP